MNTNNNIDLNHLLAKIRLHSKEYPIYSSVLENYFETTGPQIRDAIRQLRRAGYPIANSPKGYFYAKSYAEIEPTLNDLENRALSQLETISKLKSHFFPAKKGQPNLFNQ